MNKLMIVAALCAFCTALNAASGSQPKERSQNHVPEKLDESIRPFYPQAAKHPHIVLVNVDGAIPDEVWSLATTYAVSRLQLNVWTNSLKASVLDKLVADPRYTPTAVGNPNSLVGVYFERRKSGCPLLASPAGFSVVNVEPYFADVKDPQLLRDRCAKLVMKGIATACGGGNTLEPFCAMFYGAQDPAGMDKASIAIAPMCYFPMLEILRAVGGAEMISACLGEEE